MLRSHNSSRRFVNRLKKLKADETHGRLTCPDDDSVASTTLGDESRPGKEAIERKTVLCCPPSAITAASKMEMLTSRIPRPRTTVADAWFEDGDKKFRRQLFAFWSDENADIATKKLTTKRG